uniref:Uncharacterized protein n=1 Tax=Salmonella phage PMBT22 TaxID=3153513 RepID=A0AAU8GJ79_9CAUD
MCAPFNLRLGIQLRIENRRCDSNRPREYKSGKR